MMRTFTTLIVVAATVLNALGIETMVEVTGERVNLRAGRGLDAPIVGAVSRGEKLAVWKITDEWVRVDPPAHIGLWVHGDFVEEGRITGKSVNLRIGPTIRDASVARLTRDERVRVRSRDGAWYEISPPDSVEIWISRRYVAEATGDRRAAPSVNGEPPSRADTRIATAPPLTPIPVAETVPPPATRIRSGQHAPPATPLSTTITPPQRVAEARRSQQASDPRSSSDGIPAQYEGVVQRAAWVLHRPSRYRLVGRERGRDVTLCYVVYDARELTAMVGQSVLAIGRVIHVDGVRHRVLNATKLVPR